MFIKIVCITVFIQINVCIYWLWKGHSLLQLIVNCLTSTNVFKLLESLNKKFKFLDSNIKHPGETGFWKSTSKFKLLFSNSMSAWLAVYIIFCSTNASKIAK